jgi:hypothetical protein
MHVTDSIDFYMYYGCFLEGDPRQTRLLLFHCKVLYELVVALTEAKPSIIAIFCAEKHMP